MATRRTTVVERALEAKGMTRDENHHSMFRKEIAGVTHVVTRTSHGSREIGDSLGKRMANQCYLRLREFWDLIDCPLSEEGWEELIRERCVDGRNPFLGQ